jgi:hypothetical protein
VANLVILSNETHRDLRINNLVGSDYTRLNVISVVPREFPRLLAHYPIFFTKANDSGQHEPAVLLGFERGENLFLEGSGWDASYVPLQVQRQPFSLVPRQPDVAGGQPTSLDIAVDEASPLVSREAGERLFQDDGKATQYLSTVTSVLSTLVSGAREAYAFTAKLAELNLLEPVRVDVEFTDKSTAKLGGLYWIAGAVLKTAGGHARGASRQGISRVAVFSDGIALTDGEPRGAQKSPFERDGGRERCRQVQCRQCLIRNPFVA